jgi:hypothetical protein
MPIIREYLGGGNMVNQRMWKLFLTIFGSDVIDKFIDENKDDYLDLILDMERKKRQAARGTKCVISLPLSLYAIAKESNPNVQIYFLRLPLPSHKQKIHQPKAELLLSLFLLWIIFYQDESISDLYNWKIL